MEKEDFASAARGLALTIEYMLPDAKIDIAMKDVVAEKKKLLKAFLVVTVGGKTYRIQLDSTAAKRNRGMTFQIVGEDKKYTHPDDVLNALNNLVGDENES